MVVKLFTDRILKNENWAYLWKSILTFYAVFLLYAQVKGYRNMLKLSCRPLAFTLFQAFLKKQKEAWNYSLCLIFCKIFEEEYFSSYILLTDRILLSDCLFFLRCWAIYMYCNCLFSRLWRHKLFAFQVLTS